MQIFYFVYHFSNEQYLSVFIKIHFTLQNTQQNKKSKHGSDVIAQSCAQFGSRKRGINSITCFRQIHYALCYTQITASVQLQRNNYGGVVQNVGHFVSGSVLALESRKSRFPAVTKHRSIKRKLVIRTFVKQPFFQALPPSPSALLNATTRVVRSPRGIAVKIFASLFAKRCKTRTKSVFQPVLFFPPCVSPLRCPVL